MAFRDTDKRVDVNSVWRQKVTTSKRTGKVSRKGFRVDFDAEPLMVNVDAHEQNQLIAGAMAEHVVRGIKGVTALASPETIARRQRATRDGQSRWYQRNYTGGRTGETPPSTSVRLFNDSGRLTNVTLRPRTRSTGQSVITMNLPANRLDPKHFRSAAAFRSMVTKLREHVPIIAGRIEGESLDAIRDAHSELLNTLIAAGKLKQKQLLRTQLNALKAASKFFI